MNLMSVIVPSDSERFFIRLCLYVLELQEHIRMKEKCFSFETPCFRKSSFRVFQEDKLQEPEWLYYTHYLWTIPLHNREYYNPTF